MSDSSLARQETELERRSAQRRLGRTSYLLIGLAVGLVLAVLLLWVTRGNPFSSANEVLYSDVVVGSVSDEAGRLCWAEDPDRRDSPQTCAILALDPEIEVPEPGDLVTIGLVELRTPAGDELSQVVHLAPASAGAGDGADPTGTETPTGAGTEPSPSPTAP